MRNDAGNVIKVEFSSIEHGVDCFSKGISGEFKDSLPVHADEVGVFEGHDGRISGSEGECFVVEEIGAPERHVDVVGVLHERAEDALFVLIPFKQDGASAVAEQNAGGTIGPIGDSTESLDANHQCAIDLVANCTTCDMGRSHHRFGHVYAVDAARARSVQIECDGVVQAKCHFNQRCLRRDGRIRRDGHANKQIDT